ncbi:hypothetical protein EZV62_027320 [Acer yangbiense]|uniref:Uncharacterized protein n=1 Tax=Acer yangbiense TaxID=1000413 RepID=A0A5C7GV91_9ROSI|nr:hypothetical protein EZV62_027320 [Acer yangbiense]
MHADLQRILKGGPWSFDQAMIVFDKPAGVGEIKDLKFKDMDFWVQIHNIPLLCMTRESGTFLGRMIGEVHDINLGYVTDGSSHFLRDSDDRDMSLDVNRRLGVWLKATSPMKRSFKGTGRILNRDSGRYRGSGGFKFTGGNDRRTSKNWRGNRTAMVGGTSGECQVEKGSRVSERHEVLNHLGIREDGKVAVEEHIDECAKSVHGEKENRGAMIASSTRKQLQFPTNGLDKWPDGGLSKYEKWSRDSDPIDILGDCIHIDSGPKNKTNESGIGKVESKESEPVPKLKSDGKWKRVRQGNRKVGQNEELGEKLGKRKEICQVTKGNREDSSSQSKVVSEGKRLRETC